MASDLILSSPVVPTCQIAVVLPTRFTVNSVNDNDPGLGARQTTFVSLNEAITSFQIIVLYTGHFLYK